MTHFMDVDTGLCDHDAGSIAKDNLELAATQNKAKDEASIKLLTQYLPHVHKGLI